MYQDIEYTVDKHIAIITLNRPDRLNAWTGQMEKDIRAAMDAAAADANVRAIVVTGAGSRLRFGISGGTLNSSDSTLSLQVLQGGLLSGTWLHPGDNPNGTASITVDGPGSALAVRDFSVGHGTVDVRITNGATATAINGMQVGCCNTATPKTLLVRGTGSTLVVGDWPNTGGTFNFGFDGTGNTGTVDQGGSVTVNNNAYVGQRGTAALSAAAVADRANAHFDGHRAGRISFMQPPAIPRLGDAGRWCQMGQPVRDEYGFRHRTVRLSHSVQAGQLRTR